MSESGNKVVQITQLFDKVLDILDHGSHTIFSNKVSVPEDELVEILEQLREAIPKEVDRANHILAESENLVNKAQKDAERILADARDQATAYLEEAKQQREAILNNDEMVRAAEDVANELHGKAKEAADQAKAEAEAYCRQTCSDALRYADEILGYLEETLKSASDTISQNRSGIAEQLQMRTAAQDSEE